LIHPLDLGKIEENKINLVYLMEKIGNNSYQFIENNGEYSEILKYFAYGNYFSKLNYAHAPNHPNFTESKGVQIGSPFLIDPHEFKEEIKKAINFLMRITERKSEIYINPLEKEKMQISVCYLLGFIEEEIYPGIINEL
jgi:hypothetical protein